MRDAIAHGDSLPQGFDASLALSEVLQRVAGDTTGIVHLQADEREIFQSYGELWAQAKSILGGLKTLGLKPQDKVILQLQRPQDFFAAFWGCILGGFVPVPLGVAPSYTPDNSKANLLYHAWQLCDNALIVCDRFSIPAIKTFSESFQLASIEELQSHEPDNNLYASHPDDLALLILTSGSTGTPKGVMLSARNLLVSAYGMATVNGLSKASITLNWMPLEHIASLVMFHFTEVYLGCQQIHVANEIILQNPLKWLDYCDRFRVTATWAPNFAYGLVNKQLATDIKKSWNLSSIRWMGNGAEAVVGKTSKRFLELLSPYGLASTAVSPGYGMSETCSGIVHSHSFSLESNDTFVEVGTPIPGISIRIVDECDRIVEEGIEGILQVKGLTVTSGYYKRPELNQEIFTKDGWFNTGDLGLIKDRHLTITGRQKEVIIINGVNYYNHEIEAVIEEIEGIEASYTAACAVRGQDDTTDKLAIFFAPIGLQDIPPLPPLKRGKLFESISFNSPQTWAGLFHFVNRESFHKSHVSSPETLTRGIWGQRFAPNGEPVRSWWFPQGGTGVGFGGQTPRNPVFLNQIIIELSKKIRKTLVNKLGIYPDYLIPVKKKTIPKTTIGKIQRKQLSKRFETGEFESILGQVNRLLSNQKKNDLPQTELEQKIVEIWQEVLDVQTVSLHDNFFELGGNSLLLMQVVQQLQERLNRQVSTVEMFQHPTVATLANYLSQEKTNSKAVRQGQQRAKSRNKDPNIDVAVIGMSCRFPGAKNIDKFWQNLCEGKESISFFSDEEILATGIDRNLINNPNYVKASPILENIELFDAEFFGYSPKEAELIDPQQRLLLECAWEGLENAGYNPFNYQGSIAFYAGASANTYLLNNVYPNRHQIDETDNQQVVNLGSMAGFQMTVANDKDYLTTRVSYKLNLTGASVNVQTACSTSLVAIHMAYQSLLNGECDMALAGGVSVHVPQKAGYLYQEGTILSPDGHCRAFDAKAQGTLFGSGAGIVVLKRLEEAERDGDCIYAVIKGSAINNDGGTKVGYFAPNSDGQARVIAEAIAMANVESETISYVEAHGTGTHLGDPIEIAALTQAFETDRKGFCAIGSVKTNVGHLNIASGVTGFIKTVLALYFKKIPPSLHFENPNPQVDFANSPFFVNTKLREWEVTGYPLRAGVNSLGIGGTNVHVVLEGTREEEKTRGTSVERPYHVLTLSAKNEKALREVVQGYEAFLEAHSDVSLADVCFTANVGRSHFDFRLGIVTESVAHLRQQLKVYLDGEEVAGLVSGRGSSNQRPKIAFLFTGQGSQYVGMGQELYETQPTFRAAIDKCAAILGFYLNKNILEILYSNCTDERPFAPTTLLNETAYTQPAIFALEYALYELWKSWGIEPDAVVGHSVGEYVAACVAGIFSLEDGLKLIAARGRLMQQLPQDGEMVAIFADEEIVNAVIKPYQKEVAIAAINNLENIVISGKREAIDLIIADLETKGIKTKKLNVSHAFHSPLMEPILTEFKQIARQINYSAPKIELISNLNGASIKDEIATPEYWCSHIRQPVKFAQNIETLNRFNYQILVEIGAKPTLLGMISSDFNLKLPSLRLGYSDWQQILDSLAQLYIRGINIDWLGFDRDYNRHRIALPTYPFQRKRYWIEANPQSSIQNPKPARTSEAQSKAKIQNKISPLLGQKLRAPLKEIIFESQISSTTPAFLKEHNVFGKVILPGTAYVEMALAAGAEILKSTHLILENVNIQQALILSDKDLQNIQCLLKKESTDLFFQIYSLTSEEDDSWDLHCSGKVVVKEQNIEAINLTRLRSQFTKEISVENHYKQCREKGINYGESFQAIAQLWQGENESLGLIKTPKILLLEVNNYQIHPAILDACFQIIFAALPEELKKETYLPIGLENFSFYRRPGQNIWSHIRLRSPQETNPEIVIADIKLFDKDGNIIAQINGLTSKRVSQKTLLGVKEKSWQDWFYKVEWIPQKRQQISKIAKGVWLIFADRGGIAKQLEIFFHSKDRLGIFVYPGQEYQESQNKFQIDPNNREHFQRVVKTIQDKQVSLQGIIYLWSLDPQTDLKLAIAQDCISNLNLIQALVHSNFQNTPRLWLVTRNTQPVTTNNLSPSEIGRSCLWGMGKTIALEHPEFNYTQIDLDRKSTDKEIAALWEEIESSDAETQIAFRDGNRYVARLIPTTITPNNQLDISLQLAIENRGTLDNLIWQTTTRRQPSANEIEIQVHTTGLNFRDVLNALDLYPGDPGLLGLECAGEIVAIGEDVKDFQTGDAVIAIASGSFSQYVTVDATLAVRKPDNLNFEEAATIPTVFLTAYYSLNTLAKIQPGDKILIHAAAGGVGLAAIQIAQKAGAEIFATASPHKWDFLKSLGVKHIMNSRTLDFADEVMSITGGDGVDIVLNSLSGEFIPKSLSVLKSQGRFIEIGKNGVWDSNRIAQIKPDIAYFLIDLFQITQQQPTLIQSMLRHLIEQFQSKHLKPLPYQVFDRDRTIDAFRCLQQANHIGKIIVSQKIEVIGANGGLPVQFQKDGIYLITGGLRGIGLQIARWMVDKGARNLILVGRNKASQKAKDAIAHLETTGAKVTVIQADVSNLENVEEIIFPFTTPSLKGIIHAAGILDDGVLMQQNWQRFEKVLAPKVQGAWNLHLATQNYPLDFFILFSSAASLIGSAGQANYCAANAFLDALAHHRQGLGLPALSINWGAWSDVGMAAKLEQIDAIAPEKGLEILEALLSQNIPQIGVLPVLPNNNKNPFFEKVISVSEEKIQPKTEFIKQLETAQKSDRIQVLRTHIRSQVAKILGINPANTIDINQGLSDLGMDSLASVELRNRLQTSLEYKLPSTLIFDYPTIHAIADYLNDKLFSKSENKVQTIDSELLEIEKLSESDAEALLLDELEKMSQTSHD